MANKPVELTQQECNNLLDALEEWASVFDPKELDQDEVGLDHERYTNLVNKLKGE